MTEPLLTSRELADLLGFSPSTIVDWFEAGKLPGFRIGGRLRFRWSEIETWLEAQRASAGGEVAPVPFHAPAQRHSLAAAPVPHRGGEV
jgi:excisionase family DNA binding protein